MMKPENEKLFGTMIKVHKEALAGKADSPANVNVEDEMNSAVWEMGYPTLKQVFTQRIQLPKGVTSHTFSFTYERLVAATGFDAGNVTHMNLDYIEVDLETPVGLNIGWTREYLEDAVWNEPATQLAEVGRAIEEQEFGFLYDLLVNADQSPGVLTAKMVYDDFKQGISDLAALDYKADICLLHPTEYFELLGDEKFINASVVGGPTALQDAGIKTTLGCTVFMSTACDEGTAVFMMSSKAIAVVEARAKKVEDYAYPDEGTGGLYGFVASHRYGGAVILPASIRVLKKST